MVNSFRIAEQFIAHLRLHSGRIGGHTAVNQSQLAKSFDCGTSALRAWIERLLEAKIINRSSSPGPDGVDYWLVDDTMRVPEWRDNLALALKMNMAKSPRFNVGQRFGVLYNLLREMRSGLESELAVLKEEVDKGSKRIKELEEELSTERFERNKDAIIIRELEVANRELTASVNFYEKKTAAEV